MNCKDIYRSQTKAKRGYQGCVDRYSQDLNLQQSNTAARADRDPNDMYSLKGWDNYHVARPDLITMFGGTPGVTEAELIDFVAQNRKRANTYDERLPDGAVIIRSSKTLKKEKA